MPVVIADRIFCTTTSTGLGAMDLVAKTGFLAPVTSSNEMAYCIYDDAGNWEIGCAEMWPNLRRDLVTTPHASSNGGAKVNWAAGTKTVVCGLSASSAVFCARDSSQIAWTLPSAMLGGIAGGNGAFSLGGVALGENAQNGGGGVSLGKNSLTADGVAIGIDSGSDYGVAVGKNVNAFHTLYAVALGRDITSGGAANILNKTIAVGNGVTITAEKGIAIGDGVSVGAVGGIAIGSDGAAVAGAAATNSVAIGKAYVYLSNTFAYAHKPYPANTGDTQAVASVHTQTGHTNAGSNSFVDLESMENTVFSIDVVGKSADVNNYVVGVNIVGMRGPFAIVGTPVVTVRGRSAGFAASVTASVSMVSGKIRVTLVASASIPIDWAVVARFSSLEHLT